MLYDFLGPDRAAAAYRNFFDTWRDSRDHPALQDFVAAMRPYAPDSVAYDAFIKEWFEDKVVPQYTVARATRREVGQAYEVTATVTNIGTGTMPVEVAVTTGERWKKPEKGTSEQAYSTDPNYKEVRDSVRLAAGESRTLTMHCEFKPDQVVVDPDIRILQLKRKQAVAHL